MRIIPPPSSTSHVSDENLSTILQRKLVDSKPTVRTQNFKIFDQKKKKKKINGKYRSIASLYKLNLPKSNLKLLIVKKKRKTPKLL